MLATRVMQQIWFWLLFPVTNYILNNIIDFTIDDKIHKLGISDYRLLVVLL